jgi:hypothetical protein
MSSRANNLFAALRDFVDRSRASASTIDPSEALRLAPDAAAVARGLGGLEGVFAAVAEEADAEVVDVDEDDDVAVEAGRASAGLHAERIRIGVAALELLLASPAVLAETAATEPSPSSSSPDPPLLLRYVAAATGSPSLPVRALAVRFLRRLAASQIRPLPPSLPRSSLYLAPVPLAALVARLADVDTAVAEAAADALFALAGGALLEGSGALLPAQRQSAASASPPSSTAAAPAHLALLLASVGALVGLGEGMTSAAVSPALDTDETGTVEARVYALAARICGIDEAAFSAVESSGLLERGVFGALAPSAAADYDDAAEEDGGGGEYDDTAPSDPLLAAATISLLPPLARSRKGLDALVRSGTLRRLCVWSGVGTGLLPQGASPAAGGELPDPDPLLGGFALEALAQLYGVACAAQYGYASTLLRASVLPGLFRVCGALCAAGAGDEAGAAAAVGALYAVLAADPRAVDAALADPTLLREWLEMAVSSSKPLQSACLRSVAGILHGATNAVARDDAAAGVMLVEGAGAGSNAGSGSGSGSGGGGGDPFARYASLVDRIGPSCGRAADTLDVLAKVLGDVSSPEGRFAAYDLLSAMAALPGPWGLRRVFGHPGMASHLVTRGGEGGKEGKEWKFSVVVGALTNPARSVLGDELLGRLLTFRDAGAYAVEMAGPAVATASRTG